MKNKVIIKAERTDYGNLHEWHDTAGMILLSIDYKKNVIIPSYSVKKLEESGIDIVKVISTILLND